MGKRDKNRRYWLLFITIFLISLSSPVYAQRRTIGEVKPHSNKSTNQLDYPVEQWMGKKFIFLEMVKNEQKFGYHSFSLNRNSLSSDVRYDNFVGKIIKVIDIGEGVLLQSITFIEEESKMRIYTEAYEGYVDGIAFFDDLPKAKERWLGKTVYSRRRFIRTYNRELDNIGKFPYGEVRVTIGDPLKVVDICWGDNSLGPLWIIMETTKGEKGFISAAFSWTNTYSDRWTKNRPWEDSLFEFNPRQKYKWSDATWELINNGKVRPGMNKEQVKLSWGKPKKVNKDIHQGSIHEQWIYDDNQYLYFDNEVLKTMQNH